MPKLARALPLSEQVFGITSFEVVNEVTHRLMAAEALGTGVIILAAMEENGVDSLATRDSDFDHISNLKIYKPTDI